MEDKIEKRVEEILHPEKEKEETEESEETNDTDDKATGEE